MLKPVAGQRKSLPALAAGKIISAITQAAAGAEQAEEAAKRSVARFRNGSPVQQNPDPAARDRRAQELQDGPAPRGAGGGRR